MDQMPPSSEHQPKTMAVLETDARIDENPQLQSYYASMESRLGYRLLLSGARHFGYWETDTWWPFPLTRALRSMEDCLGRSLELAPGSYVLDAGCGYGVVAIRLAQQFQFRVHGIDVVPRHLLRAQHNIHAAGLDHAITVTQNDYHHLETIPRETFDGAYTIETFVHATDPRSVLREFYRVLKPGGKLVMHEYAHVTTSDMPAEMRRMLDQVNQYAAMPTNEELDLDTLPMMLQRVGFENVQVDDLSGNVLPMVRLFYLIAYLPYLAIRLFGLETYFVNAVAAVLGYRYCHLQRYYAVKASKPNKDKFLESKKVV